MNSDILIVGFGTAGLNIAYNLQNRYHVTVIDSSSARYLPFFYRIPLMIGRVYKRSKSEFIHYQSIDVTGRKPLPYATPNVIGGSSEINGVVHVIGNSDKWGNLKKFFDFDEAIFSDVVNHLFGKSRNRIQTRKAPYGSLERVLGNSLNDSGYVETDTVWQNTAGYGRIVNNCGTLFRSSVLKIVGRWFTRFKVIGDAEVDRLIISKSVVEGVKTTKGEFRADIVILAAGTIGTNEILLRTKKHYNIWSRYKVGEGIKDHISLRINYTADIGVQSINVLDRSWSSKLKTAIVHTLGRANLLSGTGATLAIHWPLDNRVACRINLVRYLEDNRTGRFGKDLVATPGFSISFTPIFPQSSGSIKIDEDRGIVIQPNYLSSENDIQVIKEAIKFIQTIFKNNRFKKLEVECLDSEMEDLEGFIINNFFSGHHLIGGSNDIIKSDFSVADLDNLFICDASILAEFPSSNIHAPILILSEIFSRKFLSREI